MRKGFTIIELIVSIAVVAVLMAVVFAFTTEIKERSRDNKRAQDVKQIQTALDIYSSTAARFPVFTSPVIITGVDALSLELIGAGAISTIMGDPLHPLYSYSYVSDVRGNSYTITFCLETESIIGYEEGCNNVVTP